VSDTVMVAAMGVVGLIITTIGGVAIAMINKLTTKVDGRLTELLDLTRESSRAKGTLDEKERIK
jgi:uncharacterized protein YabE (DUF348 family)